MRDDGDDRLRVIAEAHANLRRLNDRFEERRAPVDVVVVEPVADWRGCANTQEMSRQQFNAWCDAGKPRLGEIIPPASRVSRDIEHVRTRVQSVERTVADNWKAAENLAEDVGAVIAGLERRVNVLAEQVAKLQEELRELPAQVEMPGAELDMHSETLDPDWGRYAN